MVSTAVKQSLVARIHQSPPLDFRNMSDDSWVKDKTILITGGASGFGAGFFRRWAAAGANVIIGDINVQKGDQLVRDVRNETGNQNLHFFHCNVTEWQSQVNFFKEAIKVSPHGGIDTVVANAGIVDAEAKLEEPKNLDAAYPPPPNLAVLDVNLTGVVYTTHLALFYLPRNPGSTPADPNCDPSRTNRDRHIILISSIAGLLPVPGQALYAASKHAVVGLYRTLRSSSFVHGVRVSLICPYFIDTPLLKGMARALLAGGTMGKAEDVVEAATRFAADPRVVGRAVSVGPKMTIKQEANGEWSLVEGNSEAGKETAIWEIYPHDFEDCDVFQRNMVALMNRVMVVRGWAGWISDMIGALTYSWRKP